MRDVTRALHGAIDGKSLRLLPACDYGLDAVQP